MLFFLSSCHFLVQPSDYFAHHSFLFIFFIAAIDILEEPKIVVGLAMFTTPTSAILVAPTHSFILPIPCELMLCLVSLSKFNSY